MRVLCVDDEEMLLEELERTVREVMPDADMISFADDAEALEFAQNNAVDIAFLDISMKTVSGIALAEKLQAGNSRTNIIFCTGYSDYALDALDINCSGYIMKPVTREKVKKAVRSLRYPPNAAESGDGSEKIEIRCFGNFDVSFRGVPVKFKYRKSRELLAYLVDRRGTLCTRREIEAAIFEDEKHEEYLTKLRRDLINTFESLGVQDAFNIQKGQIGINRAKLHCDYYDYLNGKSGAQKKFLGEYMSQYSFAEETLAGLLAATDLSAPLRE